LLWGKKEKVKDSPSKPLSQYQIVCHYRWILGRLQPLLLSCC